MEMFLGHMEIVVCLAVCLGIFCLKMETSQSVLDSAGAIACVLVLMHIAGWITFPSVPTGRVGAEASARIDALGCGGLRFRSAADCGETAAVASVPPDLSR